MKKVLLVLLSIMLYSISVEAQVGEQIDLTTQFNEYTIISNDFEVQLGGELYIGN